MHCVQVQCTKLLLFTRHTFTPNAAMICSPSSARVQRWGALVAISVLSVVSGAPRFKRQGDYTLPSNWNVYPGKSASAIGPIFPFHPDLNFGVEVSPANIESFDGYLNIPIPTWGLFDLKGGIRDGVSPLRVQYGMVVGPSQNTGLSPEAFSALTNDPAFAAARRGTPQIPVVNLPNNHIPLRCQPPFCNPFQHTIGIGVLVDPMDDRVLDGGLDFPIPVAEDGVGVRFPLSGGLRVGAEPIAINYGHALGPVNPFRDEEDRRLEAIRARQAEEAELLAAQFAAGTNTLGGTRVVGDPFAGWTQRRKGGDDLPDVPADPFSPFDSLPFVP